MKKLFKPAAILLYLLVILNFFILGMSLAALTGAADDQGLTGGAIVLFYGFVSAMLAFVVSLFVVYNINIRTIKLANKLLSILLFSLLIFFTIRFYVKKDDENSEKPIPQKTTVPID